MGVHAGAIEDCRVPVLRHEWRFSIQSAEDEGFTWHLHELAQDRGEFLSEVQRYEFFCIRCVIIFPFYYMCGCKNPYFALLFLCCACCHSGNRAFFMPKEIVIVLKNRMFSNAVLMALLAAGFESLGREYLHDGVHLHLKVPNGL